MTPLGGVCCVEHLNRCKPSSFVPSGFFLVSNLQGSGGLLGVHPTKTLQVCCDCTYLPSRIATGWAEYRPMDISNGFIFCTAFAIWRLFLFWLFGSRFEHFSPFLNSVLDYELATSELVYFSTFRIFVHWISDRYFVEDSFFSWSAWSCVNGIQIPTDPLMDLFLV